MPFFGAPQDDDFSLVCEYSVGRASAVATSLLHGKYMNVLMGRANFASATSRS
ncbi:MAG: hypothetical protein F6K39_24120 [Okeania sp. SIO3B3]|nr:hypothetical protein [Okeania sp. SIO3B3]